jgi:hypothetical protein
LKLYRQQMILDHKIPDEGSETSSGHESTTSTEGSHGTTTESASGSEGTGTSSAETAHASGASEGAASSEASHEPSARKLAKRAIESIHPNESEYRPTETSLKLLDEPFDVESKGYLALGQYIVSSATVAAIGLISSELNTIGTSSHLTRRSAPAESGGELADLTEEEKIFVYKTFLIFGGIILVINSLIKTLNTKLSGKIYI